MASPKLRKQNLTVLLQGKGAKSALACVLHAKPPYVSAMLSARKSLDAELCRSMARALGLPDDWFEAPHTAADIPAATLQRLAPLPDAATDTDTALGGDMPEVAPAPMAGSGASDEAASAAAELGELSTGPAGIADGDGASQHAPIKQTRRRARTASQPSREHPIEAADQVEDATSAPTSAALQALVPASVEIEVQPAAQESAPALRTEAMVPLAPVSDATPFAAAASPHRAALQTINFTPVLSQPLVIEGGLAPITEALIKILVLKAKQGAIWEAKAL